MWPTDGGKALLAGNDHIVISTGAVDDEQFAVCAPAANNAHMGIIRVEHQVAGLSVLPTDISTVAVLLEQIDNGSLVVSDPCAYWLVEGWRIAYFARVNGTDEDALISWLENDSHTVTRNSFQAFWVVVK